MKNIKIKKFIGIIAVFGIVFSLFVYYPFNARAASITSAKDTMTRIKLSTTSDHTIAFALPTGVDFDSNDELRIDFPSAFSQGGTWATADFTFNDGTSRTINAVESTASPNGSVTGCSNGANNVGVEIDTTNLVFAIIPCGGSYSASSTAATITFSIDGTTSDGTLTNPSSAGSYAITISNDEDNDSSDNDTTSIAVAIADDDQVVVTASVDASITFDLDTSVADGENDAPYTVALGTIPIGSVRVSGTTDSVNMIIAEGSTNGAGGMVVTVANANGSNGLVSTSTPADNINSADGAMSAGTENYGLCVMTASLTGFSRASPYNSGSCATNTETNDIQGLTTGGENILSVATPLSAGHAEIAVQAAISASTVAHADYTDTLTFIATGTF